MKSSHTPLLTTLLQSRALVPFDPEREEELRRSRRRKSLLFGADQILNGMMLAAVIIAAGLVLLLGPSETLTTAQSEVSPPRESGNFVTSPVRTGDLLVRVAATGTVEPERLVEVSTEISGSIKAVHVDNNDVVKAGQLLAELDAETLSKELLRAEAQVSAARAKMKEAQAQIGAAQRDVERKSALARKKLTPERELDQARAEFGRVKASIDALGAELAAAEASYAIAQSAMKKTRIVSPIDGVILRRNVEPGQTVAASLQAPVLFRLARSLDQMQIRVDVDEADALQVRAGQEATFSVQALRDRQLRAHVEKLFVGPEIVQGVVTYKAILRFDNRDLKLKPGMTASAEIVVHNIEGGLLVPNAALRFSPPEDAVDGAATGVGIVDSLLVQAGPARANADPRRVALQEGMGRVFIEDRGKLKPIVIGIGASDGTMTEVVSGPLREGQNVVVDIASGPGRAGG